MAEVQPLPYFSNNRIVVVAPLTARSTKNLTRTSKPSDRSVNRIAGIIIL